MPEDHGSFMCREISRAGSDEWQPPACFGLNCTTMGGEENWMPCLACSAAEMADPSEEILE